MDFAPTKWEPHAYQMRAARFLIQRGAAALFLDPGLGKTSIVLAAFQALRKRKLADKMLVVAPLAVCHGVWPEEVSKWLDFVDLRVEVLHGSKKLRAWERDADIYVINYDGLRWFRWITSASKLRQRGVNIIVMDELSKLKNARSQRSQLLYPLLPIFQRRWGLTGTPASNGLLNLFGQIKALDLGRSLGQYYSHYRSKYFLPTDENGWNWVPQEDAEERIIERLKDIALRMSAEEYLTLPRRTFNTVRFDLPPKARKNYDQMEAALWTEMEDGSALTAAVAAAASGKCRQICSGAVYGEDKKVIPVHDSKTKALKALIEELQGQQVLIAYEWRHEVDRIREALGADRMSAPNIGGGTKTAARKDAMRRWNEGELTYLLAHTQSLSHGVNLQHGGRHVVFFSTTWDQELYDQFIRRVWRQGQKRRVFIHHFVARDTVEESVMGALQKKTRVQDALLKALRKRRRGK